MISVSPRSKAAWEGPVQVGLPENPPALLVDDQVRKPHEKGLPLGAEGAQQAGVGVVDDLEDLIPRDVAVAHDQRVGSGRAVVLEDPVVELLPELLPFLPLPGHVVVARIDPALPIPALKHREAVFHPDVAAATPFQPVDQFAAALPAGDELRHLRYDRLPIVRVHPGHGVPLVELPRLRLRHAGHGGEPVRQEFGKHAAVGPVADHGDAPRKVFDHRLEILLQARLFLLGPDLLGDVVDVFHIGRDAVPVGLHEAGGIKPPAFVQRHLMRLPVGGVAVKRAEAAGRVLPVQRGVTFLPDAAAALSKKLPRLVDVEQVVVFPVDDVDAVRRLVRDALEELGLRRHAGKHPVKPGGFRQRSHPAAVEVQPDEGPVLMAHPAGDVEYLPAFQRGPRRGEDPGPVRLIYGVEGVPPDDLPGIPPACSP